MIFFSFLLLIIAFAGSDESEVNKVVATESEAWGPGLSPVNLVFPARYFFVKLRDKFGNVIEKPDSGNLDVHISGKGESGPCKVWSNILTSSDGIHIVRYKLYNTCKDLKIDLRFDNMPIRGFPKTFRGTAYPEDCYCPKNLDEWLADMKCRETYGQIEEDLKYFDSVKFTSVRDKILRKFTNQGSISLCHYVIRDNEVYRKCYGDYVDFKIFLDAILNSLTRKIHLPNVEFFVNLGDWPLEAKSSHPLPIFSWCGSNATSDIVMPTYDLTEATLECMGRVARDMLSVQGNTGAEWQQKMSKAFWRGRDSSLERLQLIKLARNHPDLINASLTNFFFFRNKEKEFGPKENPVPFFDFFQYKYQINLDGTVAAYRLPFLLAGDSVVLKQESSYFEHFYRDLVPMVHHVPFKRDLSDLVDAIKWLRENDDKARNISRQGRQFARENLMPSDVFCYYVVLLKEWSKRLSEIPKVLPGMDKVARDASKFPCTCERKAQAKDEL